MKNAFGVLELWLVTGTAAAGVYHVLEGYYYEGQAGRFDEVQGTWAGRCYEESDPDRPIAAAVEFFYSDPSRHGLMFVALCLHRKRVNQVLLLQAVACGLIVGF